MKLRDHRMNSKYLIGSTSYKLNNFRKAGNFTYNFDYKYQLRHRKGKTKDNIFRRMALSMSISRLAHESQFPFIYGTLDLCI